MSQIDLLGESRTSDAQVTTSRQGSLFPTLVTVLDRLADDAARDAGVIPWGCPVLAFGDPTVSRVATLGLNPSNREFVDEQGKELIGEFRRFHTLASLGLAAWEDADTDHLDRVLVSCREYFAGNPYDRWFHRLDTVVSVTGASFYNPGSPACHLDLIPYATARKWTELSIRQRSDLLELAGDTLALLLRRSAVRVLILNGQSVVSHFQAATGTELRRTEMPGWALPRRFGGDVLGYGYEGWVDTVSDYPLQHEILVLGFNHNLQSSYGVTSRVIAAIRRWIGKSATEALRTRVAITA